jgi:predicted PurR-regulated permease PerM
MSNRRRKRKSDSKPNDVTADTSQSTPSPEGEPAATTHSAESPKPSEPTKSVQPSMARILSTVMLILGIIAVGALFYKVMAGFFVPLFLAALLVVIFRPVHTWIYHRIGDRPRLASLATTSLILMVVLMPIILLLSVATSQFTAMISHMNIPQLSEDLNRARKQLGISLEHAEQFRRLDVLVDTLDEPVSPDRPLTNDQLLVNINEALVLLRFLQPEDSQPEDLQPEDSQPEDLQPENLQPEDLQPEDLQPEDLQPEDLQPENLQPEDKGALLTDTPAADAEAKLMAFADAVRAHADNVHDVGSITRLNAEEQFHVDSVAAAAAIRTWMREFLGGTFKSQLKMLANPSAETFKDLLKAGRKALQPRFVTVTSATGSFLLQTLIALVVLVISVYFFLLDGPAMTRTLMRLSPLDDNYEERLLGEFDRTSRAVVLASVLSALVQGILAATAFYFLGFHSVILLFLVTSLMALVPFLGAASVWVPCAIYLGAVEQRWCAAIFLAIYGAAVVSSIDNVIKMYVLHGRSTLHPLFALLSVLGGVKVFGPIGILVGPMVVVFLQTLLEILNHELALRDESEVEVAEDIA